MARAEVSELAPGGPLVSGAPASYADVLESVLLRLPGVLGQLDPERLVVEIVEIARELTGAEFGMFASIDAAPRLALVGVEEMEFEERPDPRRAVLLAEALAGGQSLRIDDVSQWALSEESARPYGTFSDGRMVRSYLSYPVRNRAQELLGSMLVGHGQARAFDRRAERLLEGMCDHLAVALENASLFRDRTRVALALEESLLPPLLPSVPGVELGARYRATGAGNLVGGDFYDVFSTGPGEWGVVLGDVSGFGPEAAALTGLARYTVRAVARHEGAQGVLSILNEALFREGKDDRFCTAVFLKLRRSESGVSLDLAIAGHPPPVILRDDGSTEMVDGKPSMLLGQFPDADVAERGIDLQQGDALVLYTDGVIEARGKSGEQFGQDCLVELLSRSAGRTADGLARRVDVAVMDFQGGTALDDVAVVVLRAAFS